MANGVRGPREQTPPSRQASPEQQLNGNHANGTTTTKQNGQKLVASPERRPSPEPAAPKQLAPEEGWEYLDRENNVQGPFKVSEMRAWYTHGYFKPELRIRAGGIKEFTPLQDLYPEQSQLEPFVAAPVQGAERRILS